MGTGRRQVTPEWKAKQFISHRKSASQKGNLLVLIAESQF